MGERNVFYDENGWSACQSCGAYVDDVEPNDTDTESEHDEGSEISMDEDDDGAPGAGDDAPVQPGPPGAVFSGEDELNFLLEDLDDPNKVNNHRAEGSGGSGGASPAGTEEGDEQEEEEDEEGTDLDEELSVE